MDAGYAGHGRGGPGSTTGQPWRGDRRMGDGSQKEINKSTLGMRTPDAKSVESGDEFPFSVTVRRTSILLPFFLGCVGRSLDVMIA